MFRIVCPEKRSENGCTVLYSSIIDGASIGQFVEDAQGPGMTFEPVEKPLIMPKLLVDERQILDDSRTTARKFSDL